MIILLTGRMFCNAAMCEINVRQAKFIQDLLAADEPDRVIARPESGDRL